MKRQAWKVTFEMDPVLCHADVTVAVRVPVFDGQTLEEEVKQAEAYAVSLVNSLYNPRCIECVKV